MTRTGTHTGNVVHSAKSRKWTVDVLAVAGGRPYLQMPLQLVKKSAVLTRLLQESHTKRAFVFQGVPDVPGVTKTKDLLHVVHLFFRWNPTARVWRKLNTEQVKRVRDHLTALMDAKAALHMWGRLAYLDLFEELHTNIRNQLQKRVMYNFVYVDIVRITTHMLQHIPIRNAAGELCAMQVFPIPAFFHRYTWDHKDQRYLVYDVHINGHAIGPRVSLHKMSDRLTRHVSERMLEEDQWFSPPPPYDIEMWIKAPYAVSPDNGHLDTWLQNVPQPYMERLWQQSYWEPWFKMESVRQNGGQRGFEWQVRISPRFN
jgi:hypothetical protein